MNCRSTAKQYKFPHGVVHSLALMRMGVNRDSCSRAANGQATEGGLFTVIIAIGIIFPSFQPSIKEFCKKTGGETDVLIGFLSGVVVFYC